jgi:hypothetical protein
MVDRSNLLEAPDDFILFQATGSGIAMIHGETRAQSPEPEDWRDLVSRAFNLEPGFQFDAVFVFLGTNDLSCILRRRSRSPEVPNSIGKFLEQVDKYMVRLSVVFGSPACYLGCGMGSMSITAIPKDPDQAPLIQNAKLTQNAVTTRFMPDLLTLLNAAVCNRASGSWGADGYVRDDVRAVCFGMSPLRYPQGMTAEGTGHYRPTAYSHLAVALRNSMELVLVKLRVLPPPPQRSPMLIKTITDAKRYADTDGNIRPYSYCTAWTEAELSQFGAVLTKCTTNGEEPELAPHANFSSVPHSVGDVVSCGGLFQLGQVAAIKLSEKFKAHDPEHHGIVIDSNDSRLALVFDIEEKKVAFVPHVQLVVPSFMAPDDPSVARVLLGDLLQHVKADTLLPAELLVVMRCAIRCRFHLCVPALVTGL